MMKICAILSVILTALILLTGPVFAENVTLAWDAPDYGCEQLCGYVVHYSYVDWFGNTGGGTMDTGITELLEATIVNLNPRSGYSFFVTAYNTVPEEESDPSNTVTKNTGGKPTNPKSVHEK